MTDSITLIKPTNEKDWADTPLSIPLSLAALAAYLTERGVKVNTCDIGLREEVKEADWYGITSLITSRTSVKELASLNGEIVFGGPDPSADPEYYLEIGKYVIRGEGEKALFDIIKHTEPLKVSNLSYKTSTGFQHNVKAPLLDMNELPLPAYELFAVMKYADIYEKTKGHRWQPIVLTRGCPYDCFFCAHGCVFGISWRAPPPAKAVDMIEKLLELGELEGLHIGDSIFGFNRAWSEAVCREIIRRKLSFKWFCYMRVDRISAKLLGLMKKAGCIAIDYGLESGSQKRLDSMNKQITVEAGRRAVELTERKGIIPILSFVIGTPGEVEDELEKTEDFWNDLLDKYDCVIVPSIYYPLKTSTFYKRYGEQMSEIPRERLGESINRIKFRMEEKYGGTREEDNPSRV